MGENKEQDTEETDKVGVGGEKTSRKERQWAGKMGKIEEEGRTIDQKRRYVIYFLFRYSLFETSVRSQTTDYRPQTIDSDYKQQTTNNVNQRSQAQKNE